MSVEWDASQAAFLVTPLPEVGDPYCLREREAQEITLAYLAHCGVLPRKIEEDA